jgi:hypothetical protein
VKKQITEGFYWFSEEDYIEGKMVKLWYDSRPCCRGWWCTPLANNEPAGYDYPLNPDVWRMLKTESEMQTATGKRL